MVYSILFQIAINCFCTITMSPDCHQFVCLGNLWMWIYIYLLMGGHTKMWHPHGGRGSIEFRRIPTWGRGSLIMLFFDVLSVWSQSMKLEIFLWQIRKNATSFSEIVERLCKNAYNVLSSPFRFLIFIFILFFCWPQFDNFWQKFNFFTKIFQIIVHGMSNNENI